MKTILTGTSNGISKLLVLLPCLLLLSACATSGGGSRISGLLPLPRLEDPQMESMLQRLTREHQHWVDPNYLNVPATPQPWPCEISQSEKNNLSGVPNMQDPKLLAAEAEAERNAGFKRGAVKKDTIENVQVYFLKGACSSGKLVGDVELLAVYQEGRHWGDSQWRTYKVFSRFNAVDGERVGEMLRARSIGNFHIEKSLFNDIRMATTTLDEIGPSKRIVSITTHLIDGPKSTFSTETKIAQTVSVLQPLGGDRSKSITYDGTSKDSEVLLKGDKLHGKWRTFAHRVTYVSWEPYWMEASEQCYDEGEPIKSAACEVE